MTSTVVPVGAATLHEAGGKAEGLQRLIKLGLPVPSAWVIGAGACRDHLTQLAGASAETRREQLLALSLSASLTGEIGLAIEALGPGPYAVRSSALAEDGSRHSFAGQHDTVLDVADMNGVLDAVKRCWASAWSDRAVAYRASAGLGSDAAVMAVVLQRMVRADAAGVVFTRDPSDGSARLVIEALPGLGEALVSGRAAPDRFILTRPELNIAERHIEARAPVDDALIARIAKLGLQAEAALGGPQDLEWAVERGEPVLLQARPITTLARPAQVKAPKYVWSNTNTGELLPEVATPITFEILDLYVRALLQPILNGFGIDLRGAPLIGRVGGRVYFCLNTVSALMSVAPGMKSRSMGDLFGGNVEEMQRALDAMKAEDRPPVRFSWRRALTGAPVLLSRMLLHINVRLEATLARAQAQTRRLASVDLRSLDDRALMAHFQALNDGVFTDLHECFFGVAMGTNFVGLINSLSTRWLGDHDGSMASTFFSGMGGLDSAEAGLDMWRLATHGRSPALAVHLRDAASTADLRQRLTDSHEGRAFLARWEAFLVKHGHHARGEIDVAVPRWREEQDAVLGTVRAMAFGNSTIDPEAVYRRRTTERETIEREHLGRLNPIRRVIFRASLVRAQRALAMRENMKSEAVRRLSLTRDVLLEIGRRLVERDRVERREDVFFLGLNDLSPALAGGTGWKTQVTTARRDHVRNQALHPPPLVIGEFDPRTALPLPPSDARLLRGLAVSPGVVEGKARVILSADAHQRLEPGEILVAPFTDPGWAPYFVAAAGLVVDMGGMLSHGSIVAREYGIPAVVNVGPGTRAIRTGQRIRVDGHRGEVVVLD